MPIFRQTHIPSIPEIRDGIFITSVCFWEFSSLQVTSAGMSHLLGVTAHNFHHLSLLIILCGACATLPLPLAQFIPDNTQRLAEEESQAAPASEMERMEELTEVPSPACRESADAEGGQRCTGQREANVPMLGEAAMPAG